MTSPETPSQPQNPDTNPKLDVEEATAFAETKRDYRIDQSTPLPATEAGANFEQMERPKLKAARSLTRLIGVVLGDDTNAEAVSQRTEADHLKLELLKNDSPLPKEEIDAFFVLLKPITARLEKMGISEYSGMANLKNPYAYTSVEGQKGLTFDALYTPWSYVNGKLSLKVDINKLRKTIEKMPEKTELDRQKKEQALIELDVYEAYIDNEVMNPTPEEDRYEEPSPEHLNDLAQTLDLANEELITQVGELPDAVTAGASEERKKLNKISGRASLIIDFLKANTKIVLDKDKSQYPEFWAACDKNKRIKTAVGSLNLSTNTIRRDN